jgi:transposase
LLGARQATAVIADKGYDSDVLVESIEVAGDKAVIPPRSNRKVQRNYDQILDRKRNQIERCFSKLKRFRRFATCYEKSKTCFQAFFALACSWIILQLYVDTA